MIDKQCFICDKSFKVIAARTHSAKYCSTTCRDIGLKQKTNNQKCSSCGTKFHMKQSQVDRYARKLGVFCSYKCAATAKSNKYTGVDNPNYKGKNVDEDGYRIYTPSASYLLGLKRMKLHQAVCCEALGILEMPKGIHIHHRDCSIQNNEPTNLAVLSISDHKWLHKQYGVATLWAYCIGRISLDELVSWSDNEDRARKLLPLDVTQQTLESLNLGNTYHAVKN